MSYVKYPTFVGKRFGMWTVLRTWRCSERRLTLAELECDCGGRQVRQLCHVTREDGTRACGSCCKKTHASSGSPEYVAWAAMRNRCCRETDISYPHYGGRGIIACDRWKESFEAFFEDVGPKPSPEHSIDRIDNDGNYEPGNVRWATRAEQCANRSSSVLITLNGETHCIVEWEKILGFPRGGIQRRLRRGWSPDKALSTPHSSTPGRKSHLCHK